MAQIDASEEVRKSVLLISIEIQHFYIILHIFDIMVVFESKFLAFLKGKAAETQLILG